MTQTHGPWHGNWYWMHDVLTALHAPLIMPEAKDSKLRFGTHSVPAGQFGLRKLQPPLVGAGDVAGILSGRHTSSVTSYSPMLRDSETSGSSPRACLDSTILHTRPAAHTLLQCGSAARVSGRRKRQRGHANSKNKSTALGCAPTYLRGPAAPGPEAQRRLQRAGERGGVTAGDAPKRSM